MEITSCIRLSGDIVRLQHSPAAMTALSEESRKMEVFWQFPVECTMMDCCGAMLYVNKQIYF